MSREHIDSKTCCTGRKHHLSEVYNNGKAFIESNRQERYLGDCQGWAPLLFKNIKADAPVAVDIRMENLGSERHLQTEDGSLEVNKSQLL